MNSGQKSAGFSMMPHESTRIEAMEKLPELLARLTKKADSTARKIKETTVVAREVAAAIQEAKTEINPPRVPLKKLIADAKKGEGTR